MLIEQARNIYHARNTLWYVVVRDLKSMHRDKLLGNVWALLEPLLLMVVLYYVYHMVRHQDITFNLYLLSGLIAWDFFSRPVIASARSLKRQKEMIHKFPLPLGIFPLAVMIERLYDLGWGLLAYSALFLGIKIFANSDLTVPWAMALLPVWTVFFFLLTLGVCFIVSYIGVFFTDMQDIVGVIMRLGFFLNPIFIKMDDLPPGSHHLYLLLNPMAGFLLLFRQLIPGANRLPQYDFPGLPYYPAYLAVVSVLVFLVGFYLFSRGTRHVSKYL